MKAITVDTNVCYNTTPLTQTPDTQLCQLHYLLSLYCFDYGILANAREAILPELADAGDGE